MFPLLRTLLFQLDAERAHEMTIMAVRCLGELPGVARPRTGAALAGQPIRCMGLDFPNRIGLAAGLDKNGEAVAGFARLGFGFVEVGTVTPYAQRGNPRPRIFRLPSHSAVINRMGFNNMGAQAMARRLARLRQRKVMGRALLGVNVGKNRDTPLAEAAGDYIRCMEILYPYADYLTLNLSSPNTPGLRQLQSGDELANLLGAVSAARVELTRQHGQRRPLLVKVAPDLHARDIPAIAAAILRFEVDGLIATNTTLARPELAGLEHADEAGGLSGAPLNPLAKATVAAFRRELGSSVPIIGVGGIVSRTTAQTLLDAGADLLQIYTGLIYEGPGLLTKLITTGEGEAG